MSPAVPPPAAPSNSGAHLSARDSAREAGRIALRGLLRAYFQMSLRGKGAQMVGRNWGSGNRGILVILLFNFFIGFGIASSAVAQPHVFTFSLLLHAATLLMSGVAVMSESGEILFNKAEAEVLGAAPVTARTQLLAKSLNLLGYTLLLSLVLNLPGTFMGLILHGARPWFPIVHLCSVLLMSGFCASLVVFAGALTLRFASRERMESVLVWVQIALNLSMVLGYQMVPRLIQRLGAFELEKEIGRLYFLPPAWFAGFDMLLSGREPSRASLVLAVSGIAVTVLLAAVALQYLSAGFARGLSHLSEAQPQAARETMQLPAVSAVTSAWRNPLLRLWVRDPVERAVYDLASASMKRDRDVRLRVYPGLVMLVALPLMGLLERPDERTGIYAIFAVWFLGMAPALVLESLRMSSNPAAADVFHAAPLRSTAPLFHGVRKAAFVFPMLPVVILSLGVLFATTPDRARTALYAAPMLIALPTLSLLSAVRGRYVPLSKPMTRGAQGGRVMLLWWIGSLASGAVLALTWAAIRWHFFWPLLAGMTVAIALVHRTLLGRIAKTTLE